MLTEEEFEGHLGLTERKSFYKSSDFKTTEKEIEFAKSKPKGENKYFIIGMCFLIALLISVSYNYKQFQDNKDLESRLEFQKEFVTGLYKRGIYGK